MKLFKLEWGLSLFICAHFQFVYIMRSATLNLPENKIASHYLYEATLITASRPCFRLADHARPDLVREEGSPCPGSGRVTLPAGWVGSPYLGRRLGHPVKRVRWLLPSPRTESDTCENITFPCTTYVVGNSELHTDMCWMGNL